jgi:phytoene dehydrogenase-like protein
MNHKEYKIIIIGAGISGLSTGLAFSKVYDPKKNPALIIEKQKTVGGCVTTFARQGYRFDTVQIIPDLSNVMEFFDIETELTGFGDTYANLFLLDKNSKELKQFPIASDRESFENYLIKNYPDNEQQIRHFFDYSTKMHEELNYLKTQPNFFDIVTILFKCHKILANSGKTYKQYLGKFKFSNPEIIEVLDTFSSFSGLSGNRCAALLTACAMITTLKGSYRPVTGFITFPQMLRKKFEERGGKVFTGTEVLHIIAENNKAVGVELSDGRKIYADYIVSTADTRITFSKLLGCDVIKKADKSYAYKVKNVQMSPSAFAIHLGLDDKIDLKKYGLDCGYSVFTTGRDTHEKAFDEWENNVQLKSEDEFHFGIISPSAIIGGKQTLILHVVPATSEKWIRLRKIDYDLYCEEKMRTADYYIGLVCRHLINDLKEHILFMDVATPATYARFTGTPDGANFDMMPVPGNFGKNRLSIKTPVKNLFQTRFSHGIWPSMQVGLQVVDSISGGKIMNGNATY